jgi:hypothetical protein
MRGAVGPMVGPRTDPLIPYVRPFDCEQELVSSAACLF